MSIPRSQPTIEQKLRKPFAFEVDIATAFTLLGTIQLALRHPKFAKSPPGEHMHAVARAIQKSLELIIPEYKFLMDAGWHEKFDVP